MNGIGRMLALVVTAGGAGCAQLAPPPAAVPSAPAAAPTAVQHELRVAAGRSRELCFAATAGELVTYRFEATGPLDFNLHYHVGNNVYYPVPAQRRAAAKGQYRVPADQTYCLMWTNDTAAPVDLTAGVTGAAGVVVH